MYMAKIEERKEEKKPKRLLRFDSTGDCLTGSSNTVKRRMSREK